MTNVAPRGVPSLPWISEFPEVNVRTYVRVGDRPGVYFFSLDAGSPGRSRRANPAEPAVLPGFHARAANRGRVDYSSHRSASAD